MNPSVLKFLYYWLRLPSNYECSSRRQELVKASEILRQEMFASGDLDSNSFNFRKNGGAYTFVKVP